MGKTNYITAMYQPKDIWTTVLVVLVSIIAVKIGIQNLQWGLKAGSKAIQQLEQKLSD
ncbi:MAG: hypothetical protein WA865_16970 [Spirulinaceae cyanobacterium]